MKGAINLIAFCHIHPSVCFVPRLAACALPAQRVITIYDSILSVKKVHGGSYVNGPILQRIDSVAPLATVAAWLMVTVAVVPSAPQLIQASIVDKVAAEFEGEKVHDCG